MGEGRVSYGVSDSDDARDVGCTYCLRIFYGNSITMVLSGGKRLYIYIYIFLDLTTLNLMVFSTFKKVLGNVKPV